MIRCACWLPWNSFSFASALYVRHSCYYHNSMNALKVKCLHMYHVRASQHIYIYIYIETIQFMYLFREYYADQWRAEGIYFRMTIFGPTGAQWSVKSIISYLWTIFPEFYIILWLLKGFFDRKIHSHTRVLDWIHDFISTLA